jgi:hypothetical protein
MNRRKFLKATGLTALAIPFTDFTSGISQRQTNELKMFTNGIDTVICKNIDEARWIIARHYYDGELISEDYREDIWGYNLTPIRTPCNEYTVRLKTPIYYDEVDGLDDWHALDPESTFTLYMDYPEEIRITKKAKDWITEHGYGYFASTEY